MAKRHFDSAYIKPLLTGHPAGGGVVKDWQRLSREACVDGTIRHVFENAVLGLNLCVTEYPEGRFAVGPAIALQSPAAGTGLAPARDGDEERNRLADEYMRLCRELVNSEYCDDDVEERMEALAPLAGRALANRFVFALEMTPFDGEPAWCVTPAWYWEQEAWFYDGCLPGIEALVPRGAAAFLDNTFVLSGTDGVLGQAALFFAAGFVWSRAMQDAIDPEAVAFIAAVEAASAPRAQAAGTGQNDADGDGPPPAPRP